MHIEIESIDQLHDHLERHGDLQETVVQGLDLRRQSAAILRHDAAGAVFLGCRLKGRAIRHVLESGGLVFPRLPAVPYHSYRPALYTAEELMAGYERGQPESYAASLDQQIYHHYDQERRKAGPPAVLEALAQRLHDHAIDDALHDLLHTGGEPRKVIAIMGGHSMLRTDRDYRRVAEIARQLTRSDPAVLMASGGGPGAMEACHLGAWLAPADDTALDQALEILAAAPSYRDPGWLDTAFDVRERFPEPGPSLGIPTWFYGHEPPNLLATHIAKYFSNSLREDGLLAIAQHGVVYAPGSAGTIQEVFMDAAQNHYGTFGNTSPMVFLGREFWSEVKPIYPLLRDLADDRQYCEQLTLCDTVEEVVDFILAHPPQVFSSE